MKPLAKGIHDFNPHWFGSASELGQREETVSPTVILLACPDHGMLPHCLPVQNPASFLIAQHLGLTIPHPSASCQEIDEMLDKSVLLHEVTDFIVCSHTNCAIHRNWLSAPANSKSNFGSEVIAPTLAFVDRHYAEACDTERFGVFLREHVLLQLENLSEYPLVRSRLNDCRLKLHGWVLDEGTGRFRAYDALIGDFVSVDTDVFGPTFV